ncbi:flagellar hook-associated protein FlgK [Marinobacterium aestuariivivens]|uniref:Flagellar hook-associated protein 1 n=1 Tax=Marinobacterium aestuariivivens TaxID=1698799 RepID=A0ABW1ZX68_9GAMM
MSSFNLMNIGIQALQSNSTALNVVGQNIANVNTEGYSRQRAEFGSREQLGGVQILDVSRIADQFLTRQIWSDTSSYNNALAFEGYANELDNLLASDVTSISVAMDEYFGALQTVVDDPVSLPNRELFLAEADALVRRFNDLDASLERQNDSLNGRLESSVQQVNAITSNIATLNDKLRIASASGAQINELLDQRDRALEQLSGFVNFTTVETPDTGEIDVFIGNGQPLIVGRDANPLVMTLDPADAGKLNVSLQVGRNLNEVGSQISGGQIGGLLEYRSTVLDRARDEIGIVALGFAATMNEQHGKGMDLDGELGGNLFNDLTRNVGQVLPNAGNASPLSSARIDIENAAELEASEYRLVFSGTDSFTLIRESDGRQFTPSDVEAQFSTVDGKRQMTLQVDGFELTLQTGTGGNFVQGDQVLIRPARTAASDIALALKEPRELALASPLKIEADSGNQGSGVASVEVVNGDTLKDFTMSGQPIPEIRIEFSDDGAGNLGFRLYNVTDPQNVFEIGLDGNAVVSPGALNPFTAGDSVEIENFGYSFTIDNRPDAGDGFTLSFNEGGVSDNRNALAMSDLQFAKVVDGASYQDQYGQLIERVGTQTQVAQINAQASKSVLDANIESRSSISGVNLDEEAAKLIQFQQAYQASSQLIRASQTIFDALLAAV